MIRTELTQTNTINHVLSLPASTLELRVRTIKESRSAMTLYGTITLWLTVKDRVREDWVGSLLAAFDGMGSDCTSASCMSGVGCTNRCDVPRSAESCGEEGDDRGEACCAALDWATGMSRAGEVSRRRAHACRRGWRTRERMREGKGGQRSQEQFAERAGGSRALG
ncbi:hypothetical protein FGB62_5g142 [Gracilaria domingensis]|nr:hypothetical protein FGB62_5g142 [Gracilaria domingensis]